MTQYFTQHYNFKGKTSQILSSRKTPTPWPNKQAMDVYHELFGGIWLWDNRSVVYRCIIKLYCYIEIIMTDGYNNMASHFVKVFYNSCEHQSPIDGGLQGPWPQFNIKMLSYRYRKSHCGDKMILRPSYLHNGISYTGNITSLYWIEALICKSDY